MRLRTRSCEYSSFHILHRMLTWCRRTDIEQEANALYSFDREDKLDATEVKAVLDARILRQSRLLLEGAAPVGAVLDDMDVEQGQKLRLICPSRSRMVPPQDVIRVTTAVR